MKIHRRDYRNWFRCSLRNSTRMWRVKHTHCVANWMHCSFIYEVFLSVVPHCNVWCVRWKKALGLTGTKLRIAFLAGLIGFDHQPSSSSRLITAHPNWLTMVNTLNRRSTCWLGDCLIAVAVCFLFPSPMLGFWRVGQSRQTSIIMEWAKCSSQ